MSLEEAIAYHNRPLTEEEKQELLDDGFTEADLSPDENYPPRFRMVEVEIKVPTVRRSPPAKRSLKPSPDETNNSLKYPYYVCTVFQAIIVEYRVCTGHIRHSSRTK